MNGEIDGDKELMLCRATNNAINMIEPDAKSHYQQMINQGHLTEIGFEYVKQMVLWLVHNEDKARELMEAENKRQAAIKAMLDGVRE